MWALAGKFAAISGLLLACQLTTGCSFLAPSDEALMGQRGALPSKVPPEPPVTDGLVFWLDGATEVETRDEAGTPLITAWRDLSGNGHDALQPDSALAPAWIDDRFARRRAVVFNPDEMMTISAVPLQSEGFTLLLVAESMVYAAADMPVAFGVDGPRLAGEDDQDLSFRVNDVTNANDIDTPFAWVPGYAALTIARVAADGLASVRVDGHEVLETRMVTPVSGSFDVALGNAAAMFAVVGLYDRALTPAEEAELERSVSARWACCKP